METLRKIKSGLGSFETISQKAFFITFSLILLFAALLLFGFTFAPSIATFFLTVFLLFDGLFLICNLLIVLKNRGFFKKNLLQKDKLTKENFCKILGLNSKINNNNDDDVKIEEKSEEKKATFLTSVFLTSLISFFLFVILLLPIGYVALTIILSCSLIPLVVLYTFYNDKFIKLTNEKEENNEKNRGALIILIATLIVFLVSLNISAVLILPEVLFIHLLMDFFGLLFSSYLIILKNIFIRKGRPINFLLLGYHVIHISGLLCVLLVILGAKITMLSYIAALGLMIGAGALTLRSLSEIGSHNKDYTKRLSFTANYILLLLGSLLFFAKLLSFTGLFSFFAFYLVMNAIYMLKSDIKTKKNEQDQNNNLSQDPPKNWIGKIAQRLTVLQGFLWGITFDGLSGILLLIANLSLSGLITLSALLVYSTLLAGFSILLIKFIVLPVKQYIESLDSQKQSSDLSIPSDKSQPRIKSFSFENFLLEITLPFLPPSHSNPHINENLKIEETEEEVESKINC